LKRLGPNPAELVRFVGERATEDDAIGFDLGRVLIDYNFRPTAATIGAVCGRTPEDVMAAVDRTERFNAMHVGRMDTATYVQEVLDELGLHMTHEAFLQMFTDIYYPETHNLRVVEQLADVCNCIWLFSNITEPHAAHVRANFPHLLAPFGERAWMSHEVGVMKPNADCWEWIKAQLPERRRIFFIDDREENVLAATKAGLVGVWYSCRAEPTSPQHPSL